MATPYDKTSAVSIFNYSKQLIDHCLRDFAPDASERKGKGGLGQLVEELFFEYEVNNSENPDFEEAGVELKCTPLKLSTNEELLIKERLVCCMINYCNDVDKSFENSHFYKKCLLMLILFYLHQGGKDKLDLQFLFALLWRLPDKDLAIIKNDYNVIIGKIRQGNAHEISEGDTMYLGACRKGQKGESAERQPYNEILAPRRAWCLKPSYMRTLLGYIRESGQKAVSNYEMPTFEAEELVTYAQLSSHTFDEIVNERFAPYFGKNCNEIFDAWKMPHTNAKDKYFIAANAIASQKQFSNVNMCEEFKKAGLLMKTVRVKKNGIIKESMSFENIDYQEVYDCDEWFDSRLYELFSNRFLFVVFKETDGVITLPNGTQEPEYVLDKAFFWTMPQTDLAVAEAYWNNIRQQVLDNHIELKYFWKIGDHNKFHVRPKARIKADMADNPNGGKCLKFCYWFNSEYVRRIIESQENK